MENEETPPSIAVSSAVAEPLDVSLCPLDNFPLAGRLWTSPSGPSNGYVALVNAGAGIASRYYDRFAAFLAENGVPTLVYDYRGIGRSRPHSLRGFNASVEDWGSKDCAAAISWLQDHFPQAKILVVGHSIGGFVTGFVTNGALIDKMLLIGAHTGYWRDYSPGARPLMLLLWHVLMPAITSLLGYFPGKRLHLLEDLPKGVALEWAGRLKPEFWWNLKRADGMPDATRTQDLLARFAAIHASVLAVRFTDDPFATEAATKRLGELFVNTSVVRIVLGPTEAGGQSIGHFGFFDSRFRSTLWPLVVEVLKGHVDRSGLVNSAI
jgi:predicted alpha/beta hydrolase